MSPDWYCEKLSCKMLKSACDKRHAIANGPASWTQIDRFLACLKCDPEKSGRRIEVVETMTKYNPEKACTKCKKMKPIEEYNINKGCRDGHENTCKSCKAAMSKARRMQQSEEKVKAVYVDPPLVTGEIKGMTLADIKLPITTESGVVINEMSIDEPQAQLPITDEPQRGPKEKTGKTDWSVFPFSEADQVVHVFEYGTKKYGRPFSYRDGIPLMELWSAIMRHMIRIQDGESMDPESGCSHMAHIAANALMALSQDGA